MSWCGHSASEDPVLELTPQVVSCLSLEPHVGSQVRPTCCRLILWDGMRDRPRPHGPVDDAARLGAAALAMMSLTDAVQIRLTTRSGSTATDDSATNSQ